MPKIKGLETPTSTPVDLSAGKDWFGVKFVSPPGGPYHQVIQSTNPDGSIETFVKVCK